MESRIAERTEALFPRIQSTARKVYNSQPVEGLVEVDDLVQEMALRILERAEQIPDLDKQTDAYLMIDAYRNAGVRTCNREMTYLRYVEAETVTVGDEGEETSIFEVTPSNTPDPEDSLIMSELASSLSVRIAELSPENQQFIALLVQGYSDAIIAKHLNVSPSAICQRRKTVLKHLSDLIE